MTGITKAEFEANENNTIAFERTVAETLDIDSDNVEVTGVTDTSTRRSLRSLTESSIEIDYTVTFNLISLGYSDVTAAFTVLKGTLVNASSSGEFVDTLKALASTYGGSDAFASVTVEVPTVSDPVQVITDDDDGSSDSKKTDNTALIVGLVVGLGGGLILIAVIAFYFMSGRGNKVASV